MKTLLLLILFALFCSPAFATDKPKPAPKPPVVTPTKTAVADNDRREDNAYGALVVSGLATAALREREYGAVLAFAGTVAAAAAIEAAHSGSYNGENVRYAALGALVGTVGTCAVYFKRGFVGCAMAFK